jgi:hypothetical protein
VPTDEEKAAGEQIAVAATPLIISLSALRLSTDRVDWAAFSGFMNHPSFFSLILAFYRDG